LVSLEEVGNCCSTEEAAGGFLSFFLACLLSSVAVAFVSAAKKSISIEGFGLFFLPLPLCEGITVLIMQSMKCGQNIISINKKNKRVEHITHNVKIISMKFRCWLCVISVCFCGFADDLKHHKKPLSVQIPGIHLSHPLLSGAKDIMAKEETTENFIAVVVLTCLSIIYLYILTTPDEQPVVPFLQRKFIIPVDTEATFEKFINNYKASHDVSSNGGEYNGEGTGSGMTDDFYFKPAGYSDKHRSEYEHTPNIPSEKFLCQESWVSIRAEANYKYLWLHGNSEQRLSATASQETPLHLRSFRMAPVHSDCRDGGYVTLQAMDDDKKFLYMKSNVSDVEKDKWYIELAEVTVPELQDDARFHFLFEESGFVLNKGGMSFVNVRFEEDGNIAGGSTNDWDKSKVAGREYGAIMNYRFVNASDIQDALETEAKESKLAHQQDEDEIATIHAFPASSEKRVISFGLYGTLPKYTRGAIRNAELAKVYFPGWVCRFYVTSDVPGAVVANLRELGAEIEHIPDGEDGEGGVLCCAVLCCAVLSCAVLSCAVLSCAVLCCAVMCSAVL
jgi:hypothetical protein